MREVGVGRGKLPAPRTPLQAAMNSRNMTRKDFRRAWQEKYGTNLSENTLWLWATGRVVPDATSRELILGLLNDRKGKKAKEVETWPGLNLPA